MSDSSLRVLLISYSFPPVGGAGVQRVLKLTKYLPGHGVQPSVLTVKNPSVPVRDDTLAQDLPPGTEVLRAATLEPGYHVKQAAWHATTGAAGSARPSLRRRLTQGLTGIARQLLIPDPQVLWTPGASQALLGHLWRDQAQVICISAPPFSQFLLAPLGRLRRGVGVVLDYRDEWSTYRTTYEMSSRLGGLLSDRLEEGLLRTAHMVTAATDEFRSNLLRRFGFLDPGRVRVIPNGYDPDDFPSDLPEPPTDRFVLSYAGTVFKLTSPKGLLAAIRLVHEREPALAQLLRTQFMGRIVDSELVDFDGLEGRGVERTGYLGHAEVLRRLAASHLELCLLDDVPGVERIYPGKIFELMYLGRPCLVLAPEGALSRLVQQHRLGDVLAPRDVPRIAAYLAERLREFQAGRYEAHARPVDIGRYHRQAQAGEFAAVFHEAARLAVFN